jgi:hypothetical protein
MKKKIDRSFIGRFAGRELGPGTWRLSVLEPAPVDIYLIGAEPNAAASLSEQTLTAATIEWRDDGVLSRLEGAAGARFVKAHNAIVHESLGELYEALPLVPFDPAAQRFWRRVFRLVRIPGGRHLLGLVAHRARSNKSNGTGSQP